MEKSYCYFCDEPKYLTINCNGVDVCENGCDLHVPINNAGNGECCVCLEDKCLIKLPNCIHTVCLKCCKTIYFGISHDEMPNNHSSDYDGPDWPFEFDDDNDNDPVRVKYEEYEALDDMHFDISLTYDELIMIRDSLIPTRPAWMNEEMFINYENERFLYHTKCIASDKLWDAYNANKIKGNSTCPLCRS
jgi:hypothetical protein